jgi:hypothetical protein
MTIDLTSLRARKNKFRIYIVGRHSKLSGKNAKKQLEYHPLVSHPI